MSSDHLIYDIAVIGGGASGMTAAISARDHFDALGYDQAKIAIFERNDRVGKKILLTGNGRCNFTNLSMESFRYHGENARFSKGALSRFSPEIVMNYFEELGVIFLVEESEKVYPLSLHATSVLDSLRFAIAEKKISLHSSSYVIGITKKDKTFRLKMSDGLCFDSSNVIVACGGSCAPSTGSDGTGYALLQKFQHKLVTPLPAIVQLKAHTLFCKPLAGNKFRGDATLHIDNKFIRKESGEILFTEYGLSGPPILQLSGYISRALYECPKAVCSIYLDFMPAYTSGELLDLLMIRRERFGQRDTDDFMTGIVHKRLAMGIIRFSLPKNHVQRVSELTDHDIAQFASNMKNLEIRVSGTLGFSSAQTTAGGISTHDFDPSTMESKVCAGLYACGEVLDIDGDCGGYNLQWAWASGMLAGISSSKRVLENLHG